jgi:hypothetical protein
VRFLSEHEYAVEWIPLLVGANLRIAGDGVALVFSLNGGVNFAWVTHTVHGVGSFQGAENSSSTALAEIDAAVGVELRLADKLLFGLRGGYRVSGGEVAVPSFNGLKREVDMGGISVGAYFIFQPWHIKSTDA